jgi:2-iminoacetate synthase ThiH
VSVLVDRALDAAGLAAVLEARRAGRMIDAQATRLRDADLLALGALADRIRAEEVGDEVRIYLSEPTDDDERVVVVPEEASDVTGLELLREVAVARIAGPLGARVRVDWARCGLELAQVALGFGADELVGRVVNKRGLPLAEGEMLGVGKRSALLPAEVVKRNELAGFVLRAGRKPRFVDGRAPTGDERLATEVT